MNRIVSIAAVILLLPVVGLAQAEQQQTMSPADLDLETVLCTDVQDRMPIGEADSFSADVEKVYLWTKVTGVTEGETTIHHVWLKDGEEMADVELVVKGSPWRTWSYKTIPPEWAGNWEVKVVAPDGNVITSIPFTVGKQTESDQPEGR